MLSNIWQNSNLNQDIWLYHHQIKVCSRPFPISSYCYSLEAAIVLFFISTHKLVFPTVGFLLLWNHRVHNFLCKAFYTVVCFWELSTRLFPFHCWVVLLCLTVTKPLFVYSFQWAPFDFSFLNMSLLCLERKQCIKVIRSYLKLKSPGLTNVFSFLVVLFKLSKLIFFLPL